MELLLRIVVIVGTILLGTYLSLTETSMSTRIIIWLIAGVICIIEVLLIIKDIKDKEKDKETADYYHRLSERRELRDQGFPMEYIDGLPDSPLLSHHYEKGEELSKESRFKEAIKEFEKCLSHPKAEASNKVAAHILIGNCYSNISWLKEAEDHYKKALKISRKVKDKNEKLQGKSAALANIGLIYSVLGQPDEALKNHREALEIVRKIGYEKGIANQLGNIGNIYGALGKAEEALKNFRRCWKYQKKSVIN